MENNNNQENQHELEILNNLRAEIVIERNEDSGNESELATDEEAELENPRVLLLIRQAYYSGRSEGYRHNYDDNQGHLRDCYNEGFEDGYRDGILEMFQEEQKKDDNKETKAPEELFRQRQINKTENAAVEAEAAQDAANEDWDIEGN